MPLARLEISKAFEGLTDQEKLYAHYFDKAAWSGANVVMEQCSEESLPIFKMLTALYSAFLANAADRAEFWASKRDDEAFQHVLQYAVMLFSNLGNYKSFGDSKFVPRCSPADFERVVRESGSSEALKLYQQIRGPLFDLSEDLLELRFGNSSYYTRNVSEADAQLVASFMREKSIEPENTRLFRTGDKALTLLIASAVNKPE